MAAIRVCLIVFGIVCVLKTVEGNFCFKYKLLRRRIGYILSPFFD